MLNIIEKKCYQNGNNSVCVIKFGIDDISKNYDLVGFKTFYNVYNKFCKKYKAICHYNDDVLSQTTFTIVGKAKCSPDDKFDAEKGMQLAMQRAYSKFNAYNMQFIGMLSMELSDIMNILDIKYHCANNQLCENVINAGKIINSLNNYDKR